MLKVLKCMMPARCSTECLNKIRVVLQLFGSFSVKPITEWMGWNVIFVCFSLLKLCETFMQLVGKFLVLHMRFNI